MSRKVGSIMENKDMKNMSAEIQNSQEEHQDSLDKVAVPMENAEADMDVSRKTPKPVNKKKRFIIIGLVAVIAVVCIVVGYNAYIEQGYKDLEKQAQGYLDADNIDEAKDAISQLPDGREGKIALEKEMYIKELNMARDTMFDSAIVAEELCTDTLSVWNDAIFNDYSIYDDFNEAIAALHSTELTKSKKTLIETSQKLVDKLMADLKGAPEDFSEAYEALDDMYDFYYDLAKLAVNPTGSLQTYGDKYSECDSGFVKAYDKTKRVWPEDEK